MPQVKIVKNNTLSLVMDKYKNENVIDILF